MNIKAVSEASQMVASSKNIPAPPKPTKSIYECLKENERKNKDIDPVVLKKKCPHPCTGLRCTLCVYANIPKSVMKNTYNAIKRKSPPKNHALSYMRQVISKNSKSSLLESLDNLKNA